MLFALSLSNHERYADSSTLRQAQHERWKIAEDCWVLTTNGGGSPRTVSGSCASRVYVNCLLLVLNLMLLSYPSRPPTLARTGARTSAIIDMSFIMMFSEGPDVSLNGSPTVSPTTAAL